MHSHAVESLRTVFLIVERARLFRRLAPAVCTENLIYLNSVSSENRIMIFGNENIHSSGVDLVQEPV